MGKQASDTDAYAFFNLLTGPQLLEQVESLLPSLKLRHIKTTLGTDRFARAYIRKHGHPKQVK